MMILLVVSFLPAYLEENYPTLTTSDGAHMIASFSIASIIFAPINGIIKNYMGAKNAIIFGFSMLTLSTAGIGFAPIVKDPVLFKWI